MSSLCTLIRIKKNHIIYFDGLANENEYVINLLG